MPHTIRSNFDMLRPYEPQLWRLGALAERYFADDPNTSLLKQRQFAELLAQSLAARGGQFESPEESQYDLIEKQTRRIIGQQWRQAGWEADSDALRYSQGTRPQRGRNLAIAEWPCEGHSADYALFRGLIPMAVVEARRGAKDVSAVLQQAKP